MADRNYQVLARKWRPQKFDQVVGQSAIVRTLSNALEQGREVFAVPGSPLDPRYRGTNDLIRQGAVDFLDKPFPQSRLLDLLEGLQSSQNS